MLFPRQLLPHRLRVFDETSDRTARLIWTNGADKNDQDFRIAGKNKFHAARLSFTLSFLLRSFLLP